MLKLKELVNRVYSGKDNRECVRFEYEVLDIDRAANDPERNCFVARYQRSTKDAKQWRMQIVLPRDRDCDSQVYTFDYILPKESMELALIAAIGLKYFQMRIKEEIQRKSDWDFVLGALLKDM